MIDLQRLSPRMLMNIYEVNQGSYHYQKVYKVRGSSLHQTSIKSELYNLMQSISATFQISHKPGGRGSKYQELAKYLSAYDKYDQVDYMTLALLPKEGEVKLKLTIPKSKERKILENGTMRYEEGDFLFFSFGFILLF